MYCVNQESFAAISSDNHVKQTNIGRENIRRKTAPFFLARAGEKYTHTSFIRLGRKVKNTSFSFLRQAANGPSNNVRYARIGPKFALAQITLAHTRTRFFKPALLCTLGCAAEKVW